MGAELAAAVLVLVRGADVGGVDTTEVFGVVDGGVTDVTGAY